MDTRPTLTRRELLIRLGAVGGTSLVTGVMNAWDLMGQPTGPRPEWTGQQPGTRVLVLGAGMSGLVVGYELGKLGYDCRILEARDRVGGLMWTVRGGSQHTEIGGEHQVCTFDDGQYFNAGAWRIPNADQGVLDYCRELGVAMEIFIDSSDTNFIYEEDPELEELSGRRVRVREVKADLWGSVSELMAKAMDQGEIDVPLSDEDEERLLEFLVGAGLLDAADHVYTPPERLRGSEGRYNLTALVRSGFGRWARSVNANVGGPAPVFQPVGGMDRIPRAFQRAVGERLTLEAEVRSIRQTDEDVRVVWRDTRTGEEREEVADYCVSCLPMSILQRIDVDLSPDMARAVEESTHSNASKMGLQMRRRFWEEDDGIFGGHLYARGLGLGEFSYPSYGYFEEKGILLGFYGSGDTEGLDGMSVEERVEYVLTRAGRVHPQMREEFESAYSVWWDDVPWSRGAYSRTPPPERLARLEQPDGRIYIGSAGASARPGWLEGAVQSAWRTIDQVHERVSRG